MSRDCIEFTTYDTMGRASLTITAIVAKVPRNHCGFGPEWDRFFQYLTT